VKHSIFYEKDIREFRYFRELPIKELMVMALMNNVENRYVAGKE
jgi:hypothetical protein